MRHSLRRSLAHRTLRIAFIGGMLLALAAAEADAQRRSRKQANPKKSEPARTETGTQQSRPEAGVETKPEAQQITSSFLIRWQGNRGVERYRLQVARDADFNDIVFDRAVIGREYRVVGLPTGTYYWRVAPAAGETGSFTRPAPVESVPDPLAGAATANVIVPSSNTGWRTATGEVSHPVPAQLRSGKASDLIAVNRDGTVYALDGATGVAMWTVRYRLGAQRAEEGSTAGAPFTPFTTSGRGGAAHVVAAFDGGVRALHGESGREAWRAILPAGRPTAGSSFDLSGDGKPEVIVVAGSPSAMYVIDGETGRTISETKLEGTVVGAPAPLSTGDVQGVMLSHERGLLELRRADGTLALSANLEATLTTAPLSVQTGRGLIVMVGSERGLEALEGAKLTPIGRITTEADTIRGTLRSIDLDGDDVLEVVLVTQRGRVAVVNTSDGKIRWFAEGVTDAGSASFADVNGDGTLDVLAPASPLFAVGFSGRDGSLIWRVEEGRATGVAVPAGTTRSLAITTLGDDAAFIVGGEPTRMGLRAVELPKGATKSVAN